MDMAVTNLTVAVSTEVVDRLRVLAAKERKSVNRFVSDHLVQLTSAAGEEWADQHRALLAEIGSRKREGVWNREEIYAERLKRIP